MSEPRGYTQVVDKDLKRDGAASWERASYGTTGEEYGSVDGEESRKASLWSDILGVEALARLTRDGQILMACRSLRLFAFGFLAVILAVYLTTMGFTESEVGQIFTLTLLGDAAISLYMTSRADVLGRRTMLKLGALLKCVTGVTFAFSTNFWLLTFAGTLGVISPAGNEVGPFFAIEQAALTQIIRDEDRTCLFAWYNLFGQVTSAIGALACGGAVAWMTSGPLGMSSLDAFRVVMVGYAVVGACMFVLFLTLSEKVEAPRARVKETPIGQFMGLHKSKGIVLGMSALFMLDAFGGAFALQTFVSNWFVLRYRSNPATLGTMVFVCNLVAGVSALFAAKLAEAIGLIMTMVVTHVPSSVFFILVPLMPNELWAIVALCARYSIGQMDQPTRNSYVMAVVDESERAAAGGVTNICRSIGASAAPYLSGLLYERPKYRNVPFYLCGGLKILYDVLLLSSFASVQPPEERARADEQKRSRQKVADARDSEIAPLYSAVPFEEGVPAVVPTQQDV